jgi:glycosyltransferase involved in cell wall biosynthesis
MLFSFVIIGFNEEKNARMCIDSILALHGLKDYEVLFVNDGSIDSTAEIVQSISNENPSVRLIDSVENKGRGYARHLGVQHAKGEYIIFVDADIRLPPEWLETCLTSIDTYDALGGIAVPDGDVHYIYHRFGLRPKSVAHTTEITGSNCIFKASVLRKHNYDPTLREGEDVDLSLRLRRAGVQMHSMPGLYFEHREHKNFPQSFHWLFECGRGATRQLFKFRLFRLPDFAFFGFTVCMALLATELVLCGTGWTSILLLSYPLLTSFLHLRSRFEIEQKRMSAFVSAVLVNYSFMLAYYFGRIAGIAWLFRTSR